METMTVDGTEKRIDELSKRVDHGFAMTDRRIDDLRSEMHQGFSRTHDRIDDFGSEMRQGFQRVDADIREIRSGIAFLQRLMIGFFATTLAAIIAGVIVNIVLAHS